MGNFQSIKSYFELGAHIAIAIAMFFTGYTALVSAKTFKLQETKYQVEIQRQIKEKTRKQNDMFQKGVWACTGTLRIYYMGINQLEREVYLASQLFDEKPVYRTGKNGNLTGLAGTPFSAASIQARIEALRLLGT